VSDDAEHRAPARYEIGEARADELPRCAELFDALMTAHAAHPEFFAVTPSVIRHKAAEYSAMIEQQVGRVFVARCQGRVVGMMVAFARRAPEYFQIRRYGYLADVFIEEAHRGHGLARGLTDASLRFRQSIGVHSVRLTNARDNSPADACWEALGFRDVLSVRVRNLQPGGLEE